MENILCLIFSVTLYYYIYCVYKKVKGKTENDEEDDTLDFIKAEQGIDEINKQRDELRVLEYLITDIEVCSTKAGTHKVFTLSWVNETTGESKEYDFFVWDSDSELGYALTNLAYAERNRIRPEFEQNLKTIGERSCN